MHLALLECLAWQLSPLGGNEGAEGFLRRELLVSQVLHEVTQQGLGLMEPAGHFKSCNDLMTPTAKKST